MSSYGHNARQVGHDHFRLSWTVDFKYASSRLRHPRTYQRDTDEAGAARFAKRWGISLKRAQAIDARNTERDHDGESQKERRRS